MVPASMTDALALLQSLGAPPRLVRHVRLVAEAAEQLLACLAQLDVPLDAELVRAGVILHDAGKILHPGELDGPGSRHEPAGEALLLEHGVSPELARICRSHAQWDEMSVSLEELLVALADELWKGVRKSELEERVIDAVAAALAKDRFSSFVELDTLFEDIAADGPSRLERSRS
jgi:HD superfamily phosphodiesterase